MAVVSELFQSRMQVTDVYKPTCTFLYMVSGASDEDDVNASVISVAPSTYGNAFLRQVEIIERINDDTWKVACRYDVQPEDWSPAEISFDSTGATAHISQAISTIHTYVAGGAPAADLQGAIGYDGDRVNGVDIITPGWKRNEIWYFAAADLMESDWYNATGKVNSTDFRGYAAGELLFNGVSGNQRSPTAPYALTFSFSASPNQTGLTVGSITGISKKGWELLDIFYTNSVDGTSFSRIKVPYQVAVQKVYDEYDFTTLGIGS